MILSIFGSSSKAKNDQFSNPACLRNQSIVSPTSSGLDANGMTQAREKLEHRKTNHRTISNSVDAHDKISPSAFTYRVSLKCVVNTR